jgi:NAD-dependent SIR2 family protein deacetylase
MSNNSLADISTFEQLQNQTNSSFGITPMNAFQNDVTVTNSKEELERLTKQENEIIIQYNKAKSELEKTEKGTPQYTELTKNVDSLWKKGSAIVKAKETMYQNDIKNVTKSVNDEAKKELSKKLGELLKATSTTLESPFV